MPKNSAYMSANKATGPDKLPCKFFKDGTMVDTATAKVASWIGGETQLFDTGQYKVARMC